MGIVNSEDVFGFAPKETRVKKRKINILLMFFS